MTNKKVQHKFKRGDIVNLKSGGQWMTVENTDDHTAVMVVWMADDSFIRRSTIHEDCLESAEGDC